MDTPSLKIFASSLNQVLPGAQILGADDIRFSACTSDSRACRPGDLFVAIVGAKTDGHDHISEAIANGAAAIVAERYVLKERIGSGKAGVIYRADQQAQQHAQRRLLVAVQQPTQQVAHDDDPDDQEFAREATLAVAATGTAVTRVLGRDDLPQPLLRNRLTHDRRLCSDPCRARSA